jgi:hypothetical protein
VLRATDIIHVLWGARSCIGPPVECSNVSGVWGERYGLVVNGVMKNRMGEGYPSSPFIDVARSERVV